VAIRHDGPGVLHGRAGPGRTVRVVRRAALARSNASGGTSTVPVLDRVPVRAICSNGGRSELVDMVLDVKALTWAAQHNIDTAKLKAAKVPIYGKWYFPEIPAGVALVNLATGERAVFPDRMVAGEV